MRIAEIAEQLNNRDVRRSRSALIKQQVWLDLRSLAARFKKFLIIGSGGFAINIGGLYLLADRAHLYFLLASLIAIEISLFFTFAFNEIWTWGDRRYGPIIHRFWKYQVVNGVGMGINIGVLFVCTSFLGIHYLLSNCAGAGLAAFWNFGVNHVFTWRPRNRGRGDHARGEEST